MRKSLTLIVVLCLALPLSAELLSDNSSADEGLPSFYFLPENYPTPEVHDQGPWGTCYTFATIGAVESLLYQDGLYLDLSELYLASSFSVNGKNGTFIYNDGNNPYDDGGDPCFCLQLLSSGYGSALESDVPYSDISSDYTRPDGISPVLYVTGFSYLDAAEDSALIKERIISGNLISASINADIYGPEYALQNDVVCRSFGYSQGIINHTILLAGWDDTVPGSIFGQDTPGDGAWIIRNSWGAEDDLGYWLISYYSNLTMVASIDSYILADGSFNLYEYDDIPGEHTLEASKVANMFAARDYETLESISFEVATADFDYTVKVYSGCRSDDPVSGRLSTTTTGHCSNKGLVNVILDETVDLVAGERFSVVVTISGDDPKFAIEDAYVEGEEEGVTIAPISEPGQSFAYKDGSWTDISASGCTNLRIKAYTTDRDMSISPAVFLAAAAMAAIIIVGVALTYYNASMKLCD